MAAISFGGRLVGDGCATYVTAELGVNWVVSSDRAENIARMEMLAAAAADAGADCIKFQCKSMSGYYASDPLDAPPHDAARAPFKTRGEYIRAREPDADFLDHVNRLALRLGVQWTASPWDAEAVELLRGFPIAWVKVASASVTDLALLRAIATLDVPIVMSTGMSTLEEVDRAVATLSGSELVLAHCTSAYPVVTRDVNLSRIETLRARYGVPVGWSSHSSDPGLLGDAVMAGACWLEAHMTDDRERWGPDHAASLDIMSFTRGVASARRAEVVLGDPSVRVLECEEPHRKRLRRVG